MHIRPIFLLVSFLVVASCIEPTPRVSVSTTAFRDWRVRGGDTGGTRYSALAQITKENVAKLEVAWTYDTKDHFRNSEMQCNPIVIGRTLYVTSPKMRVIALDAATGKEVWSFDPNGGKRVRGRYRNRGVTYWKPEKGAAAGDPARILFSARHLLYAVDARTGKLIESFGNGGLVDMREGLGREPNGLSVRCTSPGTIYQDLLILGSTVSESLPAAPGHVRAYDVRTGKIRWTFRTIPRPGEFGADTWPEDAWKYIGGANCWAGSTVDSKRGLVFVPTGSAAFDFYGANRLGDNLFANSLICLRAATGERVWHFQFVKHDVWDRDLPAPPSLVTIKHGDKIIDAVAQITKSGHVFMFERETGESIYPIENRKVPKSEAEGEVLSETQPIPTKPPAFARQRLDEDDLTTRTPQAHAAAVARLRKLNSDGQYTPASEKGTVIFPGFDGGGEWGGAAFDPSSGLLYVNANEMAWILRLVKRKAFGNTTSKKLYLAHCASCHRADLKGTPPEFPTLVGIKAKYTVDALSEYTRKGAGRMSGFAHLSKAELTAISRYLLEGKVERVTATTPISRIHLKYRIDGYNKFLDVDGYPAVKPPWGTLTAIDLDQGTIRWQVPLGEVPKLAAQGLKNTGSENYGGPLVTAGGLLFIGATNSDKKFRAFDKSSGAKLWEYTLPAAGNATPSTYEVDGRQFVVISAGGGKWGNPSGGTYVAFALPR